VEPELEEIEEELVRGVVEEEVSRGEVVAGVVIAGGVVSPPGGVILNGFCMQSVMTK
jgi:hypothetical protein